MQNAKVMLKTFYVHRSSKYSFVAVGLLVITILSIGVILMNRGLYFADIHSSQVMQVTAGSTVNVADRFVSSEYVARIDRDHNIVEFQGIPADELNKIVSDLQATTGVTKVQVITHTPVLPEDTVIRLLTGITAVILISLGFFYAVPGRKLLELNRRAVIQFIELYAVALVIGLVSAFGLVSFISRFYEVTAISLGSIMLAFCWGIALIYILFSEAWEPNRHYVDDLTELLAVNRRRLAWLNKVAAIFCGVILVAAMIGLGTKFVIEGVIIGAGLTFVSLSIQVIPSFIMRLNSSDLQSYTRLLKSYNSQAAPLYSEQVNQEKAQKQDNTTKSKRTGSKSHKPKRHR